MKTDYIKAKENVAAALTLIESEAFKNLDIDLITVLNALNKQIPNTPIRVEVKRSSGYSAAGYEFQTEYDCPCCRKVNIKKGQKYCDACGQALKWGDENE